MRQIIKAVDIQEFFGKKESMSFKMIKEIKNKLNKKKHQPITIEEFCAFYGIRREDIIPIIKQNDENRTTVKNTIAINTNQIQVETQTYSFSKKTY